VASQWPSGLNASPYTHRWCLATTSGFPDPSALQIRAVVGAGGDAAAVRAEHRRVEALAFVAAQHDRRASAVEVPDLRGAVERRSHQPPAVGIERRFAAARRGRIAGLFGPAHQAEVQHAGAAVPADHHVRGL
jgi:hypothetical protein